MKKSIPLTIFLLSIIFWYLEQNIYFFNEYMFILIAIISGYFTLMVWLEFTSKNFQLKFKNKFLIYCPYLFLISLFVVIISDYFITPIIIYIIFSGLSIIFGLGSLKIIKFEVDKDLGLTKKSHFVLTIFLFCLILGIYLYLNITNSLIDTDEMRLLYDAKLITTGVTPFINFNSRSPALVYLLSGLYHFWGNKIILYRIFTAIIAWGSSIILYLIGKKFFTRFQSLLLASFYAFLPITLNFLYIKTETFSIFFALLSVLLFSISYEDNKHKYLRYISHLIMLIALLIRPTIILFYLFHILITINNNQKESWFRKIKIILLEIFITGIIFISSTFLFFKSHNSLFYTNSFKEFNIDYNSYIRFLLTPYYVPLTVIILSVISVLNVIQDNIIKKSKFLITTIIILIMFIIAYVINTFLLGFWPQYYMDFAVPFSILSISSAIFISQISGNNKIFIIIFTTIIIISFATSYNSLNSYFLKNNWNISSIQKTSIIIDNNSDTNDIIFSGNPVFSIMSDRKQFMNLSHSFYDPESVDYVIKKLIENEPRIIIVDDRYIINYYLDKPLFQNLLSSCYHQIDNSIVYKLNSSCSN